MAPLNLSITLLQPDTIWERPDENIHRIETLLSDVNAGDLIVLPEMWSTGFSMHPEMVAESSNGPALHWMKRFAKEKNAVLAGSVSVKEGHRYFNRFYFAFPNGEVSFYDKKHLFSFGKEDQHYTPGSTPLTVEIKGWKIRPVVCYDLRFPVWCRNSVDYDLLLVVANWPVPRIHHWDTLLRARAIENQSFVVGVNRIGADGSGLDYNGHSSIYDMNGTSLVFLDDKESVASINLDYTALKAFRDQFRFLQDRDQFTIHT
jgi:predicted amidohydrolase